MRTGFPMAALSCMLLASCGRSGPAPKPPAPFPQAVGAQAKPAASAGVPAQAAVASPAAPATPAGVSTESSDPAWMQCGSIEFPKPAAWRWVKPSAQFRTLQYAVPGEAELIVSVFPAGDGGALEANIERWANQFGGASSVKARSDRAVGEIRVTRVDFAGDFKGMGMAQARTGMLQLGAIVQAPTQSVFIRLLGPASVVESVRAEFDALAAGVRPQSAK
jgi:hypothetical protein